MVDGFGGICSIMEARSSLQKEFELISRRLTGKNLIVSLIEFGRRILPRSLLWSMVSCHLLVLLLNVKLLLMSIARVTGICVETIFCVNLVGP